MSVYIVEHTTMYVVHTYAGASVSCQLLVSGSVSSPCIINDLFILISPFGSLGLKRGIQS